MVDANMHGDENGNGIENEKLVIPSIRTGMKREFAMMMRSQADCGFTIWQRRVTGTKKEEGKIGDNEINKKEQKDNKDKIVENALIKKHKVEIAEERDENLMEIDLEKTVEEQSYFGHPAEEVMETVAPNVGAIDVISNKSVPLKTYYRRFPRSTLKPKVDVVEQKVPTKLKELLETGFLEGLSVHYVHGLKAKRPDVANLQGKIKGSGILCFCKACKGIEVVTPSQFEWHAKSRNKRPTEYIHFENGKSFRDILNACKEASPNSLESIIRKFGSHLKPILCLDCKGHIPHATHGGSTICDSCVALRESKKKTAQSIDTNSRSLPISNTRSSTKKCKKSSSNHSRKNSEGKFTNKDKRLHDLVFEKGGIADGIELNYYAKGKLKLSGYKSGDGIFCNCCKKVVSPSTFEAHAGCASRRKPYSQIYTSKGISLHEWCLTMRDVKPLSTDENDEVCSICKRTGELLCCEMCPRVFHLECINLPSIPTSKWYCRFCVKMMQMNKVMKHNTNAIAAGRVADFDPVDEVKKQCLHVIVASESEIGGCVLCRRHDFSKSDFGPFTIILCDQCEREYHVGCLKVHGIDELKELPEDKWFCCKECSRIHSALQQLIDDEEKELSNSQLTLTKLQKNRGLGDNSVINISWRIIHGKLVSKDNRKWLSGALSIFHERFGTIGNSSKSQNDLIATMINGRSNKYYDFGGMYCAVLTVNSKVVSAGVFRIFGQEMAEIPLIATRYKHQSKGYFKSLYSCIENFLASMNVKNLVLPATHEAESLWMNKFDFEKIKAELLKQYKRDYQMMIFLGTTVLFKRLSR